MLSCDTLCVILADGAGGMSGGERAAELTLSLVKSAPPPTTAADAEELLRGIDAHLDDDPHAGETTAVAVWMTSAGLIGASAGDSSLFVLDADSALELTRGQYAKRRLGSGRAIPVGFSWSLTPGMRVLAGTDGLFGYVSEATRLSLARGLHLEVAVDSLIAAPRLTSGAYADDASVALVRVASG